MVLMVHAISAYDQHASDPSCIMHSLMNTYLPIELCKRLQMLVSVDVSADTQSASRIPEVILIDAAIQHNGVELLVGG
jgi:hypothetical protein